MTWILYTLQEGRCSLNLTEWQYIHSHTELKKNIFQFFPDEKTKWQADSVILWEAGRVLRPKGDFWLKVSLKTKDQNQCGHFCQCYHWYCWPWASVWQCSKWLLSQVTRNSRTNLSRNHLHVYRVTSGIEGNVLYAVLEMCFWPQKDIVSFKRHSGIFVIPY